MLAQCGDAVSHVRDLSDGGVFIEGDPSLRVGQALDCKLWLNSYEDVTLSAVVRRKEAGRGVGVEFLNPAPDATERIRKYCLGPSSWTM